MTATESEVHTSVENGLGLITLNRPQAINALTHGMILAIDATLASWANDDRVRAVAIRGEGERGLCAGGDVRAIYEGAKSNPAAALEFWADEYHLNARIARYPKPYVALMDGLVMGGGVGISVHGSTRIVTERSRVGMPETRIGFVPDIGGTFLLSRCPGELGTHMGLTGGDVAGADAIHCGLADYFVPSHKLPDLLRALLEEEDLQATIRQFAEGPPPSPLAERTVWIDSSYGADTAEEIITRLRAHGGEAAEMASEIEKRSPTSVKITLRAIRSAAKMSTVEAALNQEFRIASVCLHGHDLVEGIRAQVIDKDRSPRWLPATLAEVSDDAVSNYFQGSGERELGLDENAGDRGTR
jgi:enoyl-CoA hydratase